MEMEVILMFLFLVKIARLVLNKKEIKRKPSKKKKKEYNRMEMNLEKLSRWLKKELKILRRKYIYS